jgi:phage terminase large subunit-like protein
LNMNFLWADELSSWENAEDTWNNAQFALRIAGPKGHPPQAIVSTTPKRVPLLRRIIDDPGTVVTRGSTFENAANLDPGTLDNYQRTYGGTSLGQQELMGILLDEVDGALWSRALLDKHRVREAPTTQPRCVVSVDPSGSTGRDAVGIVVACTGADGHGYVLADLSGQYSPVQWGSRAVRAYHEFNASGIVAESNFGAEMVASTIRTVDPSVPVKLVFASRGKAARAEPVVSLYEQGRVHHVGMLQDLEDEQAGWCPGQGGPSPNRLDAAVWALTELMTLPQAKPARTVHLNWIGR